jgi:hypothetical protein
MRRSYLFTTTSFISALCLLLGLFIVSLPASAQSANGSGQALEIAPPVLILSANPGQTIHSTINLRNISTGPLFVTSQINDFTAQGEAGIPKILLNEIKPTPYSIKDWVGNLQDLTMKSKELKKLPITINVPENASPGGYFGVVRFSATPPELKDTGVALQASLGSLVFLRVNGDVKEQLSLVDFSANQNGKPSGFFESTPIKFVEKVKNTGNLFEQPTGQIVITDMFGKKVASVNVNLDQKFVLQESTRQFEQTLDSKTIGNKILFGKYHAELKMTYGSKKQTLVSSIDFWVIPYRLIGVIVVLVLIIGASLFYLIKRYNQFIVKRASQTRRKK